MSLAKSALKRSFRFATLAGGIWKEEISRFVGTQEANLARLKQAKLLVEELGHLKGAAMKFGQILALESRDYFPPEVVAILEKLQNQSSFMEISEVRKILSSELGGRATRLKNLDATPIAAASIGQVHRATLDGRPVVVKIQYPGIQETVDSDIKILKRVVELGSPFVGKKNTDYSGLFSELKDVFEKETHYLAEAQFTERYQQLARPIAGVRIPQTFTEVSSDRVLVLSFENGETLSTALKDSRLDGQLRHHYAELFLKIYTEELCEWGLVQTDPNLGNFLFDLDTQELVLLDFGAVREYGDDFKIPYSRLVLAAFKEKRDECLKFAIELNLFHPDESAEAQDILYRLLSGSMAPFRSASFDFGATRYSEEMRELSLALIRELKFSPPPRNLIFLHRKLGGIFQILRRLEVKIDLRQYILPFEKLSQR